MVPIVSALIEIYESNKEGSDAANGYAACFGNEKFIYSIGIMKIILGHAKAFLKQTESRSITFDKFSVCLDAAIVRIKNTLQEIDYDICKQKFKDCRDALPVIQQTRLSTRKSNCTSNILSETDIDMKTYLINYGEKIVNSTLSSIGKRFGDKSRLIMDNITMFSKLNEYNDKEVLENPLLNIYCRPMYYKHQGIDQKIYERTDEPLLCFRNLKNELPQLRVLLKSVHNATEQMQKKKKNK